MTKILTKQLIIQKAKTDVMENIKSINLWGNDLEEISFIKEMINLEFAQLASNKIKTIKDVVKCLHLKDLNLRNNLISNFEELQLLKFLPNLKSLTLLDNPITQHPKYRQKILKNAVQLEKLDDIIISKQERYKMIQEEENKNQIKLKICEENQKTKKTYPQKKISKDKKAQEKESQDCSKDIKKSQKNFKQSQKFKSFLQDQQQIIQYPQLNDQFNIQITHENKNNEILLEKNDKSQLQLNDKVQEEEILFKMTSSSNLQKTQSFNNQTSSLETSQHILCAILSLLQQLQKQEFQFIKKEVESKLYEDIS